VATAKTITPAKTAITANRYMAILLDDGVHTVDFISRVFALTGRFDWAL
jgi:hypothetical protein